MNAKAVLVAEDSADDAARLRNLLLGAGYVSRVVTDTRSAFRAVSEEHFDLVLSDILMPNEAGEMDPEAGFKLVSRLRTECPRVPVALLTGFSVDEYIECALSHDIGNVLSKTAGEAEILKCVRMWTTGEGVFGLENYIDEGDDVVASTFRTTEEAHHICVEVDEALARMSFPAKTRRRARTMLDEITLNAIMHSSEGFNDVLDAPRQLAPHIESARVAYGGTASRFGVAVTDYMGRLTKRRVLESLCNVVMEKKGASADAEHGVGGRGLYITRALAKEYYINVKRSEMTEVILITDSSEGALDVRACSLKINEI